MIGHIFREAKRRFCPSKKWKRKFMGSLLTLSHSLSSSYHSISFPQFLLLAPSLPHCLSMALFFISTSHHFSLSFIAFLYLPPLSLIPFYLFSPFLSTLLGSDELELKLAQRPAKEDDWPSKPTQPKPRCLRRWHDSGMADLWIVVATSNQVFDASDAFLRPFWVPNKPPLLCLQDGTWII